MARSSSVAFHGSLCGGACAGGWSGPGSRPVRAYATCGSSRSRRYSAAPGLRPELRPELRLAPAIAQSRRGRPGWCEPWGGSWASGPPRPRGLGTPVKAPGIHLNRPTHLIPATFRYQTPTQSLYRDAPRLAFVRDRLQALAADAKKLVDLRSSRGAPPSLGA